MATSKFSYARTQRRPDGVLATQMVGVATGAVIEEMHRQVIPSLKPGDACWLVDTRAVPGFTADLAAPAAKLLSEYRAFGSIAIVAIITNSLVRMMGRSLCFAAGVKLVSVETFEQAETELVKLRGPVTT